ncbi:hypothetical protein EON66_08920 [archaeon]|nr:MAG: hypothetical protein EON66_08920 [archaeon]
MQPTAVMRTMRSQRRALVCVRTCTHLNANHGNQARNCVQDAHVSQQQEEQARGHEQHVHFYRHSSGEHDTRNQPLQTRGKRGACGAHGVRGKAQSVRHAVPGTSPGAAPDAATDTALTAPSHGGHDGGQALHSVRSASVASGAGGAYVDSPAFIVWVMFTSNVVGILASRTLHYQFYSWYFHMLPFLFMCLPRRTSLPLYVLALVSVELGFNLCNAEGTSTPQSSAILQAGHALVLYAIFAAPTPVRAALHPRSAAPKHKAA